MKRFLVVCAALALGGSLAVAQKKKTAPKAEGPKPIVVTVEAKSGSTLTGKATFAPKGKEVEMKLEVEKAPPGVHAVHLHETGDCSSADGKSAGGHWNPTTQAHGQWGHEHFHLGDIGNMSVGADGKGSITLTTDKWALAGGGANDINGKAIIVHEKIDDFTTQPTGNAGNRIGCGVVGTPAPKASPAPAAAPAAPAPAKK